MKIDKTTNDELKKSLENRDSVVKNMLDLLEEYEVDDTLLSKIARYNKLTLFLKDLLYLTIDHSVADIAKMYQVSNTHIYNTLKKIRKILK